MLNGYAIAFAALLVPLGKLGDVLGRRGVFRAGLLAFIVAAAAAAAPSVPVLVAARVLQAVGAAALTPTSIALVLPLFPAERRETAIGLWAPGTGRPCWSSRSFVPRRSRRPVRLRWSSSPGSGPARSGPAGGRRLRRGRRTPRRPDRTGSVRPGSACRAVCWSRPGHCGEGFLLVALCATAAAIALLPLTRPRAASATPAAVPAG